MNQLIASLIVGLFIWHLALWLQGKETPLEALSRWATDARLLERLG